MDGEPQQSHLSGTSFSSSSASTGQKKTPLNETVSKLKELLRKETYSHKETGHCYDTLQREYDDLLRKYAEAENTIDKLRIGARIKLYYEPKQAQRSDGNDDDVKRCKSVQLVHLMPSQSQKAQLSRAYSVPDNLANKPDEGYHQKHNHDDEESQLRDRIQELQRDVTNFQTLLSSRSLDESVSDHHPSLIDDHQQQKEIYHVLRNEYDLIKEMLKNLEIKGSNNERERSRAYSTNSR